ncbi:MAG: biopolymer transporter ExbD [Flavobacterium sp.]
MEDKQYSSRIIKEKFKTKKFKTRIDLAAMVSVSFLLIIFFLVTKELSRPQSMDLGMPDKPDPEVIDNTIYCGIKRSNRIITLLLTENNKIIRYRGILEFPDDKPKIVRYGDSIRKELLLAQKQIIRETGDVKKGAIVLIKPTKKSTYGNLVAILDEMVITAIPTYAIVNDFTPEEQKLLASK